jgi:SET domain-containing protein 6
MTDEEEEQLSKDMVPLADLLNANADCNNVSATSYSSCNDSILMSCLSPRQAMVLDKLRDFMPYRKP